MKRSCTVLATGILLLETLSLTACGNFCAQVGLCAPNTNVTVRIINDVPNGTALVKFFFNLIEADFNVPIGSNGSGSVTYDTGAQNIGTVTVQCANGGSINSGAAISLSPASNSTVTVDCQTLQVAHDPPSCRSLYYSARRVDRDEPPVLDNTCNNYPSDFTNPSNRTRFVTDFSAQHDTHLQEANQLYSWLVSSSPPDNTVLNNLDAGQSLESQVIYITSGSQFFAAAANSNNYFVRRAYHMLLAREPTSSELGTGVQDLSGYWTTNCSLCGVNPTPPPICKRCFYQLTRSQWLSMTIVPSHEFYQVTGTVLLYGAHLSRSPTSTEIQNLTTQMAYSGFLQGGAIPIASSDEFFQKSATQWYSK